MTFGTMLEQMDLMLCLLIRMERHSHSKDLPGMQQQDQVFSGLQGSQ